MGDEIIKKHIKIWILTVIFLVSTLFLVDILVKSGKDQKAFELLNEQANMQSDSDIQLHIENPTDMPEIFSEPKILPQYQELYQQNSDIVGWIEIAETKLSYPVMYTPNDVEYYLRRAFDKTDSIAGTPFIGYDCSLEPQSDNLLFYGHNMKNGTMFTTILSYKDKLFWEKHTSIKFDTLYQESQYEIMAAFYVTANVGNGHFEFYNFTNAKSEEDFNEFVDTCKELSLYETGVTATYGNKLITLVTCSYHSKNGRFVVVARKQ